MSNKFTREARYAVLKSADVMQCLTVSVGNEQRVLCGDDPYAATRLAIVRAAAEVGRGMP